MTKKHFIALADYMRDVMPVQGSAEEREQFNRDLNAVIRFCRAQNHNFSESTFRGYLAGDCGPSGGAVKKSKVA